MIERIIDGCLENRFLVIIATALLLGAGLCIKYESRRVLTLLQTPLIDSVRLPIRNRLLLRFRKVEGRRYRFEGLLTHDKTNP